MRDNNILLPKSALKVYIENLLTEWQRRFKMQDWNINVIISNAKKVDCCGKVKAVIDYKTATIWIYPNVIKSVQKRFPDETINAVVAHEFAHLVIYNNMAVGDDHGVSEEKLTEQLSHIILDQNRR